MDHTLGEEQLDSIENVLQEDLIELGVHSAIFIDMAGNIIVELDNGESKHDSHSLAALAAGNFGAVCSMAKMIGEKEFSSLFHKGEEESMHFSKIMTNFLLITIFGRETSLGFLRLKIAKSIRKIEKILESADSS